MFITAKVFLKATARNRFKNGGRISGWRISVMGDQEQKPKASLFPLFPASATTNTATSTSTSVVPEWLSNTSFTADPSVINKAVSSAIAEEGDEEQEEPPREEQPQSQHHSYELLEDVDEESDGEKYEKRKRRKKKRKRSRESERGISEFGSRKSMPTKDYYFDSHPDPDNLAYGFLYRYLISLFLISIAFLRSIFLVHCFSWTLENQGSKFRWA